jgi:hypothetical protein
MMMMMMTTTTTTTMMMMMMMMTTSLPLYDFMEWGSLSLISVSCNTEGLSEFVALFTECSETVFMLL